MSASRPKKGKIIPRKPLADVVGPSKAAPSARRPNPALLKQLQKQKAAAIKSEQASASRTPVRSAVSAASTPGSRPQTPISVHSTSSEDEDDELEEVEIPSEAGPSSPYPTTPMTNVSQAQDTPGTVTDEPSIDEHYGEYGDLDEEDEEAGDQGVIQLEIGGETPEERAKRIALAMRKKPMTAKDRAMRLGVHKMHVIALLASARKRNRWCCNTLLQARLLSLLPHPLQTAFNIPPSRFPDRAQRSRLFLDALQSLVTWWSQSFFDVSDWTLGLRTRTWDEVQEVVDKLPKLTRADVFGTGFDKPIDWTDLMDTLAEGAGGERLRTPNSLMKKVLQQEGSRDVSAHLFVALARACGLGVRLVTSLQAVPWRAEKAAPTKKKTGAGRKGKSIASRQGNGEASDDDSEDDLEEVEIPGLAQNGTPKNRKSNDRAGGRRRYQDPADVYRLRKPSAQKLGSSSTVKPKKKQDLSTQPPVFWAEVFSRSDQRWVPVDPVAGIIRKKAHYEPSTDSGPIRMLYVVGFEEDGFARDVTLRYTKNFGARTLKMRAESAWWESVLGFLSRPYRLNRDDLEDAELETSQFSESMPQHMNGFKDHPMYVLERHLKREEVITPKKEIGRFRGEPVYRRANVVSCKTAENWMRSGRRVKEREEPLKWVKQRAVTLQKRRAQELSMQESGEAIMQGLYAEWQTQVYRPPPIKDGVVPQNSFGNIDLYAPTMLPEGGVHLPYKGIAKIAKSLGVSYAEACTGFEFKKQRAIPVINGIVVAKENEQLVLDAYEESAAAAEERERIKKVERALKRWAKLINGLRVRARLQAEYGTGDALHEQQYNPLAELPDAPKNPGGKTAASVIATANRDANEKWSSRMQERSPSVHLSDTEEVKEEVPQEVEETLEETLRSEVEEETLKTAVDVTPASASSNTNAPSTETITPRRITLRIPRAKPAPALTPKPPPRRAPDRVSKRRAPSPSPAESLAESSESDSAPRSTRKRAKAEPVARSTRSLRSRASKTDEQIKAEQEARERVKAALASDDEDEE